MKYKSGNQGIGGGPVDPDPEKLIGVDFRELGEREEDGKPKTGEMATHTHTQGTERERLSSRRKDSTAAKITLEVCPTVEQWLEVSGKWSPNLYTHTEVKDGGDILSTKDSVIKVVVVLKDDNGRRNKRIWERYPELQASSGDHPVLEQI